MRRFEQERTKTILRIVFSDDNEAKTTQALVFDVVVRN